MDNTQVAALPVAQADAAPAPAPAPAPASAPAPAAPAPQLPPPTGASGTPPAAPQAVQTAASGGQDVQSEPTPAKTRTPIDPRPYALIAKESPDGWKPLIDQVADATGVRPENVAAHLYYESRANPTVPDGKAGEIGPMQILPATAAQYSDTKGLDLHDPQQNLLAGARILRHLGDQFGEGTVSQTAAYQGGPGAPAAIAADPARAMLDHPNTMAYVRNIHAGADIDPTQFTGKGNFTPRGAVEAGSQDGPDGFIKYIAATAPRGMPMSDAWQHAEGMLTQAFLERGDLAGAQHARDYVLQMSHAGANMYLMQAHQSLSAGDSVGAAQALAKAHAFFPDGTAGRFHVDGSGNVWASRLDEHDPNRVLSRFQITPENIAAQLNQTTDPGQYLKTLSAQQKEAADARLAMMHGNYYRDLLQSRQAIATQNNDTKTAVGAGHDAARESAAQIRADARAGIGQPGQVALARDANKETSTLYGPDAMPDTPPIARATMSAIHLDAREHGATPVEAEAAARGVADGSLKLVPGQNGYAAIDPKSKQPVALVSKALGDRLTGGVPNPTAPRPSPIGGGMATPFAAGMSNDLSGTRQSSAVPIQPQTQAPPVPNGQ